MDSRTPVGPTNESTGSDDVLRAEGISVSFGANVVLKDFNLTIRSGENLAILGRSGSGKSVFLKVITGLLEPDRGEAYLWGRPTRGLGEDAWKPLRRRMGLVFQSSALFDSMTVFENVAFPLLEHKIKDPQEIRRIVKERLSWVELPWTGDMYPSALSGGMRRRVALARTLASNPEFLLYDEPTSGLDPVTGRKISALMRILDNKLRTTAIIVTHDIECARTVADRWAFLAEGRVLLHGSPDEILRSDHPELREFFHGAAGEGPARELPPQLSRDWTPP